MTKTGMAASAFILFGLTRFCGAAGPPPAVAQKQNRSAVLAKTAELRVANYAVDAAAVTRLAAELRALGEDPKQPDRALAHYQAGMATSLLASFVGPGSLDNPEGDVPLMVRQMEEAAKSFEAALALEPDFAEAHAALGGNYGYRAYLARERGAELAKKAKLARERSLELAPRNPRVVAGHAGFLFWAPPQAGGNRELGLKSYREAIDLFAKEKQSDRERHCWGEPDVWAFLAMARLSLEPPDPRGAKEAIDRALELRPDFRWARGYLLPRIQEALAAAPPSEPAGEASRKPPGRR
jgi:tetratricopeptide (TPR) repeat protein